MNLTIEPCTVGHAVAINSEFGRVNANIYPPDSDRQTHRICFAGCVGDFAHLQGKVSDCSTFDAARQQLTRISEGHIKNEHGFITTTHGMRGFFAVHMIVKDGDDCGGPQQSGDLSHRHASGAIAEGMRWAEAEGLLFLTP